MRKKPILLLLLLMACACIHVYPQGNIHQQSSSYEWPTDQTVVQKLHQWQDLKFGVLLHWGIYSVPGIVESWSICDENWITRDTTQTFQQYRDWYFGLADQFNPRQFNPQQWASVMKDAGMKYMIFTTKHHDGFCMFDSHETDFTIARHAFRDDSRSDVLRYVLDAFRQKQFMIGTYFSKPDWHSQYYWWDVYPNKGRNVNYSIKKYPWRWEQFCRFTYRQIEEILSRYGKVDILWLDGGWVCKENNQDIRMPEIARMARKHQPGLIMVDRTIRGPYENYQTPERSIPEEQLPYPWESCIPLSDDWGYVARPNWKTAGKVINTLVEVVAKGGNLVLGVGPTPEGIIQDEAVERLHTIGKWLETNGKAIYGTIITPHYHEGNVWFTSSKDGRLYAIYVLQDGEKIPETLSWTVNLPRKSIRLVSNGKKLKCHVKNATVTVTLPKGMANQSFAMEIN
ncbi:MAG: alpha-L-fucosidase [Prevotella sp.]|nr:alpha-L-fucosidase [Prevotella sp.]